MKTVWHFNRQFDFANRIEFVCFNQFYVGFIFFVDNNQQKQLIFDSDRTGFTDVWFIHVFPSEPFLLESIVLGQSIASDFVLVIEKSQVGESPIPPDLMGFTHREVSELI